MSLQEERQKFTCTCMSGSIFRILVGKGAGFSS